MGRYIPNRGFEKQIAQGLPMRNLLDTTSKRVAGGVRASAPVKTRAYRRSIGHTVVRTGDGWVGRVFSTDWAWHIVEFGSVNNPMYAPLRRGLERVLRRTKRIGRHGQAR